MYRTGGVGIVQDLQLDDEGVVESGRGQDYIPGRVLNGARRAFMFREKQRRFVGGHVALVLSSEAQTI